MQEVLYHYGADLIFNGELDLSVKMNQNNSDQIKYMRAALAQARLAYKKGEVPIGCVIVHDGEIIGRGYNRRNTDKCTLAHAEITAIRRASKALDDWRLEDCTMYVTLEPCQMCAGAIVQARIPRVYAGAASPKAGCAGSILDVLNNNEFNHQVEYEQGLMESECSALLKKFFTELRVKNKEEKKQNRMNLIFDIDGTLWDTTEIVSEAWNDATYDIGIGDKLGRFVTADMLKKEFGKPMDVIVDDLYPNETPDIKEKLQTQIKIREQERVGGCTMDLAYPEVRKTLRTLACRGDCAIYIVSNCQDGYIPLVMGKIGIKDIVADYECFGVTGLSKSDNIKLLCERNGIEPADAIYIGDTAGDYESAVAAGTDFIYARYGFGDDVPVPGYKGRSIAAFRELLDI